MTTLQYKPATNEIWFTPDVGQPTVIITVTKVRGNIVLFGHVKTPVTLVYIPIFTFKHNMRSKFPNYSGDFSLTGCIAHVTHHDDKLIINTKSSEPISYVVECAATSLGVYIAAQNHISHNENIVSHV